MSLSRVLIQLRKFLARPLNAIGAVMCVITVWFALTYLINSQFATTKTTQVDTFQVKPHRYVKTLTVVGVIAPEKLITIVSPADGIVKKMNFEMGDDVAQGQDLIDIDVSELDSRIKEAEASLLKASLGIRVYDSWNSSPEVSRARSSVTAAQMALEDAGRKLIETKSLFDRGIIPRLEYEAAAQQKNSQELQFDMAQKEFSAVLKRGDSDYRKIAELELSSAKSRMDALTVARANHLVKASVDGIILPPQENATNNPGYIPLGLGTRIVSGQALFRIAKFNNFSVVGMVSEVDVQRLKVGMTVDIDGDAFPDTHFKGKLTKISPQASSSSSGSRTPSFEITVSIINPEEISARVLRAGMSARMSINLSENSSAIIIPLEYLRLENGQRYVSLVGPDGRSIVKRTVVVGGTSETGVEIVSGLVANDKITSTHSSPLR